MWSWKDSTTCFVGISFPSLRMTILLAATTPCSLRPSSISDSEHGNRSSSDITPFMMLRLRWGVTDTGVSPTLRSDRSAVLCCFVLTCMSMSPVFCFFAVYDLPMSVSSSFATTNGDIFESGRDSSSECITKNFENHGSGAVTNTSSTFFSVRLLFGGRSSFFYFGGSIYWKNAIRCRRRVTHHRVQLRERVPHVNTTSALYPSAASGE